MNIRAVIPSDAEGVANLLNPIIEEGRYTVLDTTFTTVQERAFIEAFPARGVFNVAVLDDDSTVVGFQNIEPFASYTKAFDHVGVIGTFVIVTIEAEGWRSGCLNRLLKTLS
ncbi:hypothetical protein ABFY09_09990 [Marinomonas sp. 5E14-1]|uniref:GNAT family N-acetyltransferase n=1 Tax=Marinomonas sp. 5E14-1 TaxID=3153922 RepID=UPI0032640555